MIPRPPISTLFPYTTLFRSDLFQTVNIKLETPKRNNQKDYRPQPYIFRKSRKRIETLFSQLCDQDRKSTRLNSSHVRISYAVFCLKKKIHTDLHHRLRVVPL